MADGDELKRLLDPLAIPTETKRSVWDAFFAAQDSDDFQRRFGGISVPTPLKRQLWDMKFGATQQAPKAPERQGAIEPPRLGLWDRVWSGLIPAETVTRALSGRTPEQIEEELSSIPTEPGVTPLGAALRTFPLAAARTAGETISSLTSPGSLALAGLSGAGQVLRSAPLIVRGLIAAPQIGVGLAMAKRGTEQILEPRRASESQPEVAERELLGAAQVAGGMAGTTGGTGEAAARQVARAAGKIVAAPIVQPIKAAQAIYQTARPTPVQALTKALKPRNANIGFEQSAETGGPQIQRVAQAAGLEMRDIGALEEALQATKQDVWSPYRAAVGRYGKTSIDGNNMADAMVGSVSDLVKRENPAKAKAIADLADLYRRPIPLEEAEQMRLDIRPETESYYAKFPRARYLAEKDPDIGFRVAQDRALRQGIDDLLKQQTGESGKAIRETYGALLDLEDAVLRRKNVAQRLSPVGISEQMGRIAAAGRIGKGLVTASPSEIVAGAAQLAAGKAIAELNNTDKLIESAFHGPRAFKAAAGPTIPLPAVQPPVGLLPPAPPEPESFVRGVPASPAELSQAGRPRLLGPGPIFTPPTATGPIVTPPPGYSGGPQPPTVTVSPAAKTYGRGPGGRFKRVYLSY